MVYPEIKIGIFVLKWAEENVKMCSAFFLVQKKIMCNSWFEIGMRKNIWQKLYGLVGWIVSFQSDFNFTIESLSVLFFFKWVKRNSEKQYFSKLSNFYLGRQKFWYFSGYPNSQNSYIWHFLSSEIAILHNNCYVGIWG